MNGYPLPTSWNKSIVDGESDNIQESTKLVIIQLLITGIFITNSERQRAFSSWAETTILEPLQQTNPVLIDEINTFIGPRIAQAARSIIDNDVN